MNAIEVVNLTVQYPTAEGKTPTTALNDVSLSIPAGQWVAVVGHNGSGKSTLAKAIDGLVHPAAGSITVMGEVLTPQSVFSVRKHIGMVFQNPENQFVGATVATDVAFGLENQAIPTAQMHQRVAVALRQVGMEKFKDHEPNKLSGGQKQRVAIAGVLAIESDIVIFDEATAMLDPAGKQQVIALMKTLHDDRQLTVVSITHDVDEATLADRVVVVDDGKITADTTPEALFSDGQLVQKSGLQLPFAQTLAAKLRESGVSLPEDYYTTATLADALEQRKGATDE